MKNNNLIRFVQSLVILPVMFGGIHNIGISQNTLVKQFNIENQRTSETLALNQAIKVKVANLKLEAEAIDAYFETYDMPLLGTGTKMVLEAEKNGLDWRLLPAIAVRESTGGKHDCVKYHFNPFGWGSCRIGFKSMDEAIETVAKSLGGNNKDTAQYYAGKTVKQILQTYNPPSIAFHYAGEVMSIMDDIGDLDIAPIVTATS